MVINLKLNNPYTKQKNIEVTSKFIVANQESDFMVISDVDDTIIKSYATNTRSCFHFIRTCQLYSLVIAVRRTRKYIIRYPWKIQTG